MLIYAASNVDDFVIDKWRRGKKAEHRVEKTEICDGTGVMRFMVRLFSRELIRN